MEYVWLSVVIILTIIEVETVNLTTVWYIASGLLTLLLSFFVDNTLLQLATFTIVGTILLLTTRPILLKYIKPKPVALNMDRILEMPGVALEDFHSKEGEVKVDGKVWRAFSNEEIKKGEKVRILEIQSTKLKVEKVEK